MSGATRIALLVLAWVIAAVGIVIRMWRFDAPTWVMGAIYLGSGWMLLVDPPAFFGALSAVELAFLWTGGVLYTIGSIIFATQRPNPWPTTFGYHEVWHAFVVTAAFFHWLAIYLMAR